MDILCVGDSITRGSATSTGGYRGYLIQELIRRAYHTRLVGSQLDASADLQPLCGGHEGHDGATIQDIINRLPFISADVILLMIGSNDQVGQTANDALRADAPNKLTELVDLLCSQQPGAWVIVATIPNVYVPPFPAAAPGWIYAYNTEVNRVAMRARQAGRKVMQMDTPPLALADGVHPSNPGYSVLASAWMKAIDRVAGGF